MHWNITLMSCLGLLVVTSIASAQEGRPERPRQPQGQQNQAPLTPKQLEAAWELEATGFAHAAQLSDEQAEMVTEAYLDARKKYAKAQREMRRREGKRRRHRSRREAQIQPFDSCQRHCHDRLLA